MRTAHSRTSDSQEKLVQKAAAYRQVAEKEGTVRARAMAYERTPAVQCIDAALAPSDLTPKEIRDLETLKRQLLKIQDFYAAAKPVLSSDPYGAIPEFFPFFPAKENKQDGQGDKVQNEKGQAGGRDA